MSRRLLLSVVFCGLTALTGCSSIAGLQDAESNFACSVDMTPRCGSLSSVHESLDKEEAQKNFTFESSTSDSNSGSNTVRIREVTTEGKPIDRLAYDSPLMVPKRAPEEILRVWIAPYIDTDGDLHAEHVVFTTVRDARWAPETLDIKPMKAASEKMITPLRSKP